MSSAEKKTIKIDKLGQAGYRIEYLDTAIYVDPYLSNSVQEKESPDLERMQPPPVLPENITDASYILISHEHRDHCDLDTLIPLSMASPQSKFIGPHNVAATLKNNGIAPDRIIPATYGDTIHLIDKWKVHPVPSAHPEVECDTNGKHRWLGYVMQIGNRTIYHAGDTSPDEKVIRAVKDFGSMDFAFLPVNERNYFLDQRNIIGNMSVREAFKFAEEIKAKAIIPTHWDMFEINSVFPEEIKLLYTKLSPQFDLILEPNLL